MAYSAVDDYLTPTRAAYWGSAHRRTATPTNTYRPSSSAAYHRAASPAWEERYGYSRDSRDSGASPTTPRNQYIQQQLVQPQARSSYYYSATPSSAGYRPYDEDAASPSTPRSQYVARGRDTTPRYVDPSYSAQPATHYQASPPRLHHPTSYAPSAPVYDAPATPRGAVGGASANRWVATGSYAASPQPPLREASPVRATPTLSTRSRRAPSMIKDPLATFLPPQPSSESHRLCLALDLDETLVYARDGPVHVRPFAQEFLRQLYDMDCEVIVWTAGERDYAQSVIRLIDPMGTIEHCVYRHAKWWTGQVGYSKNLRALGRNLSRTLLVDNTPDCLKEHPQHGLLVSDFEGPRGYDDCLRTLLRVVQCIIDRPHDSVPRVLADCPDVLRRTVPLDAGGSVTVWTLANDDVIGRSDYQSARYNRDSPPRSQSRGRW